MICRRMPDVMRICLILVVMIGPLSGCTRPTTVNEIEKTRPVSDAQYRKEMEEIKKNMRGDVKIKLKKDGKGAYSWEISGKDPYEIIKNNNILSKKISGD
ncbi:MAG: hypothetical protein H6Q52_1366 [Deltaproteobacteria bacterium]|nr:hypothetical protein [Deltaproteobacteria bacterium]